MNHQERMLQAIEKVIRQAQPSIALQAVEQLIAFPNEEEKLRLMITLTDNVPEEVNKKIKAYLKDYTDFLAQTKEDYPGIAQKIPTDIVFELKLYETLQEGSKPEDLEGLVNNPDFKKCKNYPYLALNYALSTGKNEVVKESIDAMTSEQILEVSGMVKSDNPEFVYTVGKRLLKSNKKEVCERGISYVTKVLENDRAKAVELVQENLEKFFKSEKGIALFDNMSDDIYSAAEDKEELVGLVLKKAPNMGKKLARKLVSEKETFEEVLEVTSLVAETGDPIIIKEFLEEAIKREKTYRNLLEVIGASIKYEVYHVDFAIAAQALGNHEELMQTGEEFLKAKNLATADLFLRKALETSTDYEDFKLVAGKIRKQDKELAQAYLRSGVRTTKSLNDFVDLFEDSKSNSAEMVVDGLRHHSKIDDYKFALEYLQKKAGVLDILDAITEMRKQEMSKGAEKLLNEYETREREEIAKAEKEREEAEKERKKKEAEEKKKREAERKREEDRRAAQPPYFGPRIANTEDTSDQNARRFPRKDGEAPKPPKKSTPLIRTGEDDVSGIIISTPNSKEKVLNQYKINVCENSNQIIENLSEKFFTEKKKDFYSSNKYIKNLDDLLDEK